jgi:hypothetical protein
MVTLGAAQMLIRLRHLSTSRSLFCARFSEIRVPSSSLDGEFQSPLGNVALDRRLEIFLEQQMQPWNAVKHLDASINVTVVLPGVETPASFTFDAKSPPPTPAQILSLIPDSMKHVVNSSKFSADKAFAPIAAAANGRVVGLGMSLINCPLHVSCSVASRWCSGAILQVHQFIVACIMLYMFDSQWNYNVHNSPHRLTFHNWPSPAAQLTLWHSGEFAFNFWKRNANDRTLQRRIFWDMH